MQESKQSDTTTRIANGDVHAFAHFFRQQWPQVYGTALHLTRDPEQAADLAQDVFAKLWQQRERLRDVQHAENYLYIFSRNHVMDFLRKKVLHTENIEFLVDHLRESTANAQERLEYAELRVLMRQAIDSLPAKLKQVFLLSRADGLTHEQIAVRLGISTVSSKTYVVRALRHIRGHLAKHGEGYLIALVMLLKKK